jgi:poly-gamma-glutamate capsule biosynthesis protein CapA/YwtB (metallophosphatase superfamily)
VIVECEFRRGRCRSARLTPITLNEIGRGGPHDLATRGMPSFANGSTANAILRRVAERSRAFGAEFNIDAIGVSSLKGLR